ncbi:MAG: hypothetical protein K2R98_04475 [Gemmataceae bacterium]|nr:hypothetical protein [Gemmataceae bacterium]
MRPFGFVQIESWYETGDSPKDAKVEVFDASGKLLATGKIDDKGLFIFSAADATPLRIVVNAGAGHRAVVNVEIDKLKQGAEQTRAICTWIACATPQPSPYLNAALLVEVQSVPSAPPSEPRETGPQVPKLALGIGILATIAAVVTVLRRVRRQPSTAVNQR